MRPILLMHVAWTYPDNAGESETTKYRMHIFSEESYSNIMTMKNGIRLHCRGGNFERK